MSAKHLALLIVVLLAFGCTSKPDPKGILLASVDKVEKLDSWTAELEANMTVISGSTVTAARTTIKEYRSGKNYRSDIEVSGIAGLEGIEMRVYSNENGSYVCGNENGWDCLESETMGMSGESFGVQSWAERSRELIASDALELSDGVRRSRIGGRDCSFISGIVNYSKTNASAAGNRNVRSITFSVCLDDETGIMVGGDVTVEMEAGDSWPGGNELITSKTSVYVTSLSANASIEEETFRLPETPR